MTERWLPATLASDRARGNINKMTTGARIRGWAKAVRRDVVALWLAARDPRTPWYAKAAAACIAAYALSPIDLIPDFVPVLGYLDDLVLLPLAILLVVRLIPVDLMAEHRRAAELIADRPVSRGAALAIVSIWITSIGLTIWLGYAYLVGGSQ